MNTREAGQAVIIWILAVVGIMAIVLWLIAR